MFANQMENPSSAPMAVLTRIKCCFILTTCLFCLTLSATEDGTLLDHEVIAYEGADRERFLEERPHAADYMDRITVSEITYSSDGLKVKGFLVIPKDDGPFPCLIVNRGGNRDFGQIPAASAVSWLGRYASWGYVVVASQYRGVAGGEGIEEFGGAEINDVLSLVPLLESIPQADASRIGMWGGSRGGLMAYIAMRKSDRFKATVIAAGVSDSFAVVEDRPLMEKHVYSELVPHWENNREQALIDRSPIRWVDELCKTTPILLLHGSSDWRVSPRGALNMAKALYEARHPFRFLFLEGGDHGLTEYREEENRVTRDFLDYYVRDEKPWPSLDPHGE